MELELREKITKLVVKAKEEDKFAEGEIYELLVNKVYYLALKMMKNPDDAMDMVQDSFIKAFQRLDTLEDPSAFTTWLYRITSNNCKNLFVKNKKQIFSLDSEDGSVADEISDLDEEFLPQSAVDNTETKRLIKKIIDGLPDAQRCCIMMYYFSELSVRDIAETLECSEGTVKSRLNYGRKQIKEAVLTLEERECTKLYNIAPFGLLVLFIGSMEPEECLAAEWKGKLWDEIRKQSLVTNQVQDGGNNISQGSDFAKSKTGIAAKKATVAKTKIIAGVLSVVVICSGGFALENRNKATDVLNDEKNSIASMENNEGEVVVFKDKAIEKGIRGIIGKLEGTITREDLGGIVGLDFVGEYMGITDKSYWFGKDGSKVLWEGESGEKVEYSDEIMIQNGFIKIGSFENLEDLTWIENLRGICFWKVSGLNQGMVSGVENIENLENINLFKNDGIVPDFSGAKNLKSLTIIDVEGSESNFEYEKISSLHELTELTIVGNGIKNIDFVTGLTNLRSIDVTDYSGTMALPSNYETIKEFPNMEYIYIYIDRGLHYTLYTLDGVEEW